MIKKLILTVGLGMFCLCNLPFAFADQHVDSSDPIGDIARRYSTATTSTNNKQAESKEINKPQTDVIGNMLLQAVSLMGIPYKWGGNTPETGMDCSGLIRYIYQNSLGITLPRTAAEMAKVGKKISINDIQPGDLLFFNTRGFNSSHIGLYLGNNQFLQSQKTGTDIHITEFSGYWKEKFNGAKRIVEDDNGKMETFANIRNEPLPVTKRVKYKTKKTTRSRKKTTTKKATTRKKTTAKKATIHKKATTKKVITKAKTTKKPITKSTKKKAK